MGRRYYDITTGTIKYDTVGNMLIRQTPNGVLQISGGPGSIDNAPASYDFVVATNIVAGQALPNPWWKKYRSGFIEQGGLVTITGRSNSGDCPYPITFPVAFTSSGYCALVSHNNNNSGYATSMPCAKSKTTTGMILGVWATGSNGWAGGLMSWEVKGK